MAEAPPDVQAAVPGAQMAKGTVCQRPVRVRSMDDTGHVAGADGDVPGRHMADGHGGCGYGGSIDCVEGR